MADQVSKDGSVTYKVTVDTGASELEQPLTNVVTIKSDQTRPDTDTSDIYVPVIPEKQTSRPSAPPTDVLEAPSETSNPGSSLTLILVALGLFVLGIGIVTPVPAAVRRRSQR